MKTDLEPGLMKWLPHRVELPELEAWFAGVGAGIREVKANTKRSVYALAPSADAPPVYFLKHDRPTAFGDVAKTLLRPRVRREFEALKRLHDAGLPVPDPVVCGWQGAQGILVTRAVPNVGDGHDGWAAVCGDPVERRLFLARLTEFLGVVLKHGVWHPDLHAGNLLVTRGPDGPGFVLTDVFGCRVGTALSRRRRVILLSLIVSFQPELTEAECRAVLASVAPEIGWEELQRCRIDDVARRWRGRRKKVLGTCSHTAREEGPEGVWHRRQSVSVAVLEAAVRAHRNLRFNDPDGLIKLDRKRSVSKVSVAGTYYVVKEFHRPFPLRRWGPERRSWLANWRIEMCGLPVPMYHGWLRDRQGRGYLVMEYLEGVCFDVAASRADEAGRLELFRELRAFVELLYRWGIVHEDLKVQNVIVRERGTPGPRLWLIDNDAVLFDRRVSEADRARIRRHIQQSILHDPRLVAACEAVFGTQAAP